MTKTMKVWIVVISCCAGLVLGQDEFALNILHYNDFHARFEETSQSAGVCQPEEKPCIAGFARLSTMVRRRLSAEPDSLLLNGGDSFQGSLWYNILRWNVTQEFMNTLPHDAHVLGNHEFDNGVEGVVPYLRHLNQPVVVANIDDSQEPTIQGLFKPSIVVERQNRKIGIIGVIFSKTNKISSTGKLKFTDEAKAVEQEAAKLTADGVKIIVVLSHCGIHVDRQIAMNGGPNIDIIVGGHSHTLLLNKPAPLQTTFKVIGPYPVEVKQGKRTVLIVHAAAFSQFLGEIKLFFDSDGNVIRWEGDPYFLHPRIDQAADVLRIIDKYYPIIVERGSQKVGSTLTDLSDNCYCGECNLGNVICEAFLESVQSRALHKNWHYANFCIINSRSMRLYIPHGPISYASLIMAQPFENNVEVFDLRGDFIKEMLEFAVNNDQIHLKVQVSGLRVVIDGSKPANSRVLNVTVRCIECDVPIYYPLQLDKYYKVVSLSYLTGGGGEFTMLSKNLQNLEVIGVDYDLLMTYFRKYSPVLGHYDGRIQISNHCKIPSYNLTQISRSQYIPKIPSFRVTRPWWERIHGNG